MIENQLLSPRDTCPLLQAKTEELRFLLRIKDLLIASVRSDQSITPVGNENEALVMNEINARIVQLQNEQFQWILFSEALSNEGLFT